MVLNGNVIRVAKVYSDAAEKEGLSGRMFGLEGDVSRKVSTLFTSLHVSLTTMNLISVRSTSTS